VATAREARGFSREQAATASNIPGYYLTMIESDDYSSIADQLYLLPFLRRYATFVGLDAEEVASRFIRDVQRADMNPVRVPGEPISIISPRKELPWGTIVRAGAVIVVVAIAWFGYRHFVTRKATTAESKAPAATEQASPKTAVSAPAKVAPAPVPSAAVAPRMAPAPVAAAAPKSAPALPASSSGPAGSSAARPRVPVKSH